MLKRGVYSLGVCAVCLFVISISLFAEDQAIPRQVLDLQQEAKACITQKDYAGARGKYLQVLRDYPDAIWAQCGIIKVSLALDDFAAAQAASAKLLSDYSTHPDIAGAVRNVADEFRRAKHHTEAVELYQAVQKNWPKAAEAIWCQQGLACSLIQQDDIAGASAVADKLVSDYSTHPGIAKAVTDVANEYFRAGHYTKADQFCGMIINQWPDSGQVVWCRQTMAKSLFKQGDLAGAKAASDKLISDYSSRPETAATIRYMADQFRRAKHHTEAVELYRAVQKNWPDAADIWCQQGLACSLIQQDDLADAAAAAAKLVSDYSTHPEIAKAVQGIADQFRRAKLHTEAVEFYRAVQKNWPKAAEAMWCQQGLACALIQQDDLADAAAAAAKLVSDYSTHPEIAKAVSQVANQYFWAGRHTEANQLCKMILANWPDSDEAMWSRQTLIRMQIREGDLTGSEYAMNKLLSEHGSHPGISNAIFAAGEEYYLKAQEALQDNKQDVAVLNYEKAIVLWKKNMNQMFDSHYRCLTYYYSSVAYKNMGQYDLAITSFQEVVTQWPQFDRAWNAQFMIAVCYDQLYKNKQISAQEAKDQILQACKVLEEKYPKSKASVAAQILLSEYKVL